MSRAFRVGLGELASGRDGVKLRPNELRLGYQICLETFDERVTSGRIDLDRWARILDLKDSKGFRSDKVATILKTLTELGIVDVNAAQATFEPRPDSTVWLRAGAKPARALSTAASPPDAPQLPLRDERPLSEALSELSRETALGQEASSLSSEKSDDGSAGEVRRKNPTTQQSPGAAGETSSSEKSDASRARGTLTCTRLEAVQKTCTRLASEKSDGRSATGDVPDPAKRSRLQQRVRAFVGELDWNKKGSWGSAYYLWSSALAMEVVEGCLDYLIAGLKENSIRIEKSNGAALWWYFRHEMKQRREAARG